MKKEIIKLRTNTRRIKKRIKKILEIILFPVLNMNRFENARQKNSSASFSLDPRSSSQQKENRTVTIRQGLNRVLTRDISTTESSQTRSNGTKVAETKKERRKLKKSRTRMRSTTRKRSR